MVCATEIIQYFTAFFFQRPVYTVRTKFLTPNTRASKVSYPVQNGACERNGLTAYSVGCHNIVWNWITETADLLPFFVVLVKLGSDYALQEVVGYCLFDNLNVNFFSTFFTKIHNIYGQS